MLDLEWYWLNKNRIKSNFIFRQRGLSGKANAVDGVRRVRARERVGRAVPAPEANAEIQGNLDVCEMSFLLLHMLVCFKFLVNRQKSLYSTLNSTRLSPKALKRDVEIL